MSARETQGLPHEDANIERLCRLGGVSRAGTYRHFEASAPARADADLRDRIQKLSLQHRHYGYRRIAAQLRREGEIVNAKRVLRLMREDNLLCLRASPFVPRTTNSHHGFAIVPNLTRGLRPTGLDQIWVADITYVRLGEAFVYLAVVLDAYSRKVIGWALDDHLEARLAMAALDMALAARNPPPDSLIHHSDRGVQYACGDYTGRLQARGVALSMSRVGNPYDNAKAESFMKTLKAEEVNGKAYATPEQARGDIGAFIEDVYNTQRLHSALGYKPPVEFEAGLDLSRNRQPEAEAALSPN
ncbi:MAG: IS3 family transposase [Roseiarcus sp.]